VSLFDWQRRWFRLGDYPSYAADGYLAERSPTDPRAQGSDLEQLDAIPCLVLLGLPGMGKTHEINRAAARAVARGEVVTVLRIGHLSSEEELRRRLWEDLGSFKEANSVWNIYLDGLDESLSAEGPVSSVLRQLTEQFGNLDKLKLRISCRSAEWPSSLESDLRSVWDDHEVELYQLAPLRRSDVLIAANASFSSEASTRFMAEIEQRNAEVFASRPITLRMLINVFQSEGTLPREQVQLYRKGLLTLVEESNALRRSRPSPGWLDAHSRLVVASRIACALIMSNGAMIWTGLQYQTPPTRATALSEISGGYEPLMGASFPVRESELFQVIRTSLFERIGDNQFTFIHQTFAEFLCALYFVNHGLTVEQILGFMRNSETDDKRVTPQLREVCAWIASMEPRLFRELVLIEPDLLLRSDVASADPADRAILVEQLLQRYQSVELVHDPLLFNRGLERLGHSNLAAQLRPWIESRDKTLVARRAAISIATANNLRELSSSLADISLDRSEHFHIRVRSVAALSKIGAPDDLLRIKPLLYSDLSEDMGDELKGHLLTALWPDYLTTSDLLPLLSMPKDQSLVGAYSLFLFHLEFPPISATDALLAIRWTIGLIKSDRTRSRLERLAPRLLGRIWERVDESAIRGELARLVVESSPGDSYLFRRGEFSTFIEEYRTGGADKRRAFVREVIKQAADKPRSAGEVLFFPWRLLATEDLPWSVEDYLAGRLGTPTQELAHAIVRAAAECDVETVSFLWDAAKQSPELQTALEVQHSVELDSTIAQWQREEFERQHKVAGEKQVAAKNTSAQIERMLDEVESGNPFRWWEVNLQLFLNEEGEYDENFEFRSSLTDAPFWPILSDQQRKRIIAGAHAYLEKCSLDSQAWLGKNILHRPAAAAYRAVRLLREVSPGLYGALDDRVLPRWVPAILGFSSADDDLGQEVRREIVRDCYKVAPSVVRRTLARLILKSEQPSHIRDALSVVEKCFDDPLGNLVWGLLNRLSTTDERGDELLRFLLAHQYGPAAQLLESALTSRAPIAGTSIANPRRFAVAISAHTLNQPETTISGLMLVANQDAILGRDLWLAIAKDRISETAFYHRLSEPLLGEAIVWLMRNFEDSSIRGRLVRPASPLDSIDEMKRSMIADLVSRGTPAAVHAMERLAQEFTDNTWLRWQLADAKEKLRAGSWNCWKPSEILSIIAAITLLPDVRSARANLAEASKNDASANKQGEGTLPPTATSSPPKDLPLPEDKQQFGSCISRRILVVATEWSSGHGGISTFNRQLCTALAGVGHDVVCFVVESTPREKDEAASIGVRLIDAPRDDSLSGPLRLLLYGGHYKTEVRPDLVIGHDHVTGTAGYHIATRIYDNLPYVHIVHTLPEEIEPYKSVQPTLRGSDKFALQEVRCRESSIVVAVGPRIFREIEPRLASLHGVMVISILPGLSADLLKHAPTSMDRRRSCLLLGRMDDGPLKGAELAGKVILRLQESSDWKHNRPRLDVRGFSPDNFGEELAALGNYDQLRPYIHPRSYSNDHSAIASDICASAVLIMPSKREGFGLVALEAISAGIPILVSAESGLAEVLLSKAVAPPDEGDVDFCIADVDGDTDVICNQWVQKLTTILSDLPASFKRAHALRSRLVKVLTWQQAALQLSEGIDRYFSTRGD
jgi:glycosyltransferase involved in cell wall biosynthesis